MNYYDFSKPTDGADSSNVGVDSSSLAFMNEYMDNFPQAGGGNASAEKRTAQQYPENSTVRILNGVPGVDMDSVLAASQAWRVESLEKYLRAQSREERLQAIESLRKEFLDAQLTNNPEVTNIEAAKNLAERLDLQSKIQETAESPEAQKEALQDFLRAQRRAGASALSYLSGGASLPFETYSKTSKSAGFTKGSSNNSDGPITYEDFQKAIESTDSKIVPSDERRALLQNVPREVFEKAMAADIEESKKELQSAQALMRDFIRACVSKEAGSNDERERCIKALSTLSGGRSRDLEDAIKWMKEADRVVEQGAPDERKRLELDCADRFVRCVCADLKKDSTAEEFEKVEKQLGSMILPETEQIRNTLDWLRVQKHVLKLEGGGSCPSQVVATCISAVCEEAAKGNKLAQSLISGHVLDAKDRKLLQEVYKSTGANLLSDDVVDSIRTKHPEQWKNSQLQMLQTVAEVAKNSLAPEAVTALAVKAMNLRVGAENLLFGTGGGSSLETAQKDTINGFFNLVSTEMQWREISRSIFNAIRIGSDKASPLMQELYLRTGIERRLDDGSREFDALCKWAANEKDPNAIGILVQVACGTGLKTDRADASKAFGTVLDLVKKHPDLCPTVASVLTSRAVPQIRETDSQLAINRFDDYKPLLSVKQAYEGAATLYGAMYATSKKVSHQFEAEDCQYEAKEIERLLRARSQYKPASDWAEQVFHYFKNGPENMSFAASDRGIKLDFGTGGLKKSIQSIPGLRIPRDMDMLFGRVHGGEIDNNTIKIDGVGAIDVGKKLPVPLDAGSIMVGFSNLQADFKVDAEKQTITLNNLKNFQLGMSGKGYDAFEKIVVSVQQDSKGRQSVKADVTLKDSFIFKGMIPQDALSMQFDVTDRQADKFRFAINELSKNPKDRNLVVTTLKALEGSIATQSAETATLLAMFEKVERDGDCLKFSARAAKRIELDAISVDVPKEITAKIDGDANKGFSLDLGDSAPKVNLKMPGELAEKFGVSNGIRIKKIVLDSADSEGVRKVRLITDSAVSELSLYVDRNMRIAEKQGRTCVNLRYEKDECKLDLVFQLKSKSGAENPIDAAIGGANPEALLDANWSIRMSGDESSRLELLKKLGAPEQLAAAFAHVTSVEHKDGDLIFGRTGTAPNHVDVQGLKMKLSQQIVISGLNVKNLNQKKLEIGVQGIALNDLPDNVVAKDFLSQIFKHKLPVTIKKLQLVQNDDGSSSFKIVETSGLLRSADLEMSRDRKPTYLTLVVDDPIETIGSASGSTKRILTIKCRFDENGNMTVDNEASIIGQLGLNFADSGVGQILFPSFTIGKGVGRALGFGK